VEKKLEMVGIEPEKIEQGETVQDLNRIIFPALYWPKVKRKEKQFFKGILMVLWLILYILKNMWARAAPWPILPRIILKCSKYDNSPTNLLFTIVPNSKLPIIFYF
jgi:hypothetical protein